MIHGFTGSHEGFQYIEPKLTDYHLIVPDLPGFGVSTIGRKDWSIDGIAKLLNQFVAKLQLDQPPHLLGHSMGGLVVAAMIDQSPELYDRVILVSPVPTAIAARDSRRFGASLGSLQYAIGHRLKYFGPRLVKSRTISKFATKLMITTADSKLAHDIESHHYRNLEYLSNIEFYSQLHKDINRQGAIDYAKALSQKTCLLITGDNDIVTPIVEQRKLAVAIKPANLEIIPGVGHLAHYETPEKIASAIKAFLSRRR